MKILILGGTIFVGRHLVEAAQSAGHEVTLFNRGRHNPELFAEIEKLRGDRDSKLDVLKGRRWDAVIDTCGYVPRVVLMSAEVLADSVGFYVFISTLSVYADLSVVGLNEESPTGTLADETVEEITGQTYGPLKALCEREVCQAFPENSLIIRPGLIVGPHDPTDRFTYWPLRITRGGKVLAPQPKDLGLMYIDVRDLAEWIIRMIEEKRTGIYNANGPDYKLTMQQFLETCRDMAGNNAELVWADAEFLLEQGVTPWADLPLWLPGEETAGMGAFNIQKALAAGLSFRTLATTVKDTLEWSKTRNTRPADYQLRAGISSEKEQELLKLWQNRQLD
jgi:2'-hydroxyisoflavone reductase